MASRSAGMRRSVVVAVSSEQFTNEFINAVRDDRTASACTTRKLAIGPD